MKNVFFILFISIFAASCTKENSDLFVPYTNNPLNDTTWAQQTTSASAVNSLPGILSYTTKLDSVDMAVGATVKVSEFLDAVIPPAFAKSANGAGISGKVKIEITFLRKKGDFIRFDRPTTSYGRLLESGGAFFIKVTKEGVELIPDVVKPITFRIRDAHPLSNMQLFYGEQNLIAPLPVGTNPNFTWVPAADTAVVKIFTRQDSALGYYQGYEFNPKKFNWVNCDRFNDSTSAKTRISAVLPPNFTNANTAVYAVFKDQNIVVRLNTEVSTRSFYAPNFPLTKKIIVVSISKIGDDLYLGSKDPVVENNLRVSLTPEKKTKAQIDQFLDAL